ncbi:MAG TPA: extracellular solute-binding protein [Clostridia bacterium]|nr:extracellular solute-binding protein [Clostridia bacterium]
MNISRKTLALLLALALCLAGGIPAAGAAGDAPKTITWWQQLDGKAVSMKDWDDSPTWQLIQEKLNVDIQWQMPASTEAREQFSLMIASRNLPDVIYYTWTNVSGGPAQLIEDKMLLDLTDLLPDMAPNYNAFINAPENATIRRQVTLNDGTHYIFAKVFPDARAMSYNGLMIRADWLEKLGLSMPATLQEWHDVLAAFRDQDPNGNSQQDELPFVSTTGSLFDFFASAYKVRSGLYPDPDTGKIVCGYTQEGYKEFLKTMAAWYAEGLLDPEYPATDGASQQNKLTSNLGGAFYGAIAGGMGTIMSLMAPVQPEFDLAGAPSVASVYGDGVYSPNDPLCRAFVGQGAAVSADTKELEAVLRVLDFCYGEEGMELLNWGILGESYEIGEDGQRSFTDEILHNETLTPAQSVIRYAYPSSDAPTVCDYAARAQINNALPQQAAAAEIWADCKYDMLLPVLFPVGNDSARLSEILNEVNTYVRESVTNFIMGRADIEAGWPTFVKTVEGMKIAEAIEIQQRTYDAYLNKE